MTDILVREGEIEFSKPIARSVLRDSRISFGARGLFSFLWDMPRGWRPNVGHLSTMGPEGRDAIRARLSELKRVGAMRIEAIRNSNGTVAGKRWVLVAPDRWAIASPLTAARAETTEERVFQPSVKPMIGRVATKVHQVDGSTTGEAEAHPGGDPKDSAAAAGSKSAKRRRTRGSGILTWCADDEVEAQRLESVYSTKAIGFAVDEAIASGRQHVPGVVAEILEKEAQAKRVSAASDQLREEVEARVVAEMSSSESAIAAGSRLLDAIRDHRKGARHAG